MRPYCLVLSAFAILLASIDSTVAETSPAFAPSAVDKLSTQRMLRAEVTDTTPDDEERILGLNHFKSWNTNRQVKQAVKKIDKVAPMTKKDEDKALHQATVRFANEPAEKANADAILAEKFADLIGKKVDPAALKKAGASDDLVEKYKTAYDTAHAKAKAEIEAAKAAAAKAG